MSRKAEVNQERATKRAIQNNRKQKQAMSSYLAEDDNFGGFSNQLGLLGLKLRDIPGDGNCLFRALGDQLDGHSDDHCRHREETVSYMIAHRSDFEPFVEDDVPFTRHVENLRNPGTYAGNDAIVAFARKNNVNVVIHQLNAPIWTVKGCDHPNARQLHIAYHNGDHYSSIRKLTDNSNRPANIRLSECKESANVIQRRSVKKRSEGLSEYDLQKVKNISRVTGCEDLQFIKQVLKNKGYDENETVGFILESTETEDTDSATPSSYDNHNKAVPIWSKNGSGTRIFGGNSIEAKNTTNRSRNAPEKKLSNKKRQEQARRERKKRNELRKKTNTPSDSDESEILVKKLSVLNI